MKLTDTFSKKEALGRLLPVAALRPLTEDALYSVPQIYLHSGIVPIYKMPYRIGREARIYKDEETGTLHRIERHRPNEQPPTNDLYLIDRGHKLNISREHLQIIRAEAEFTVVDRLSACGFMVNNKHHGGNDSGGRAVIRDLDILTLGIDNSPFQFQFLDFTGYQITGREMG